MSYNVSSNDKQPISNALIRTEFFFLQMIQESKWLVVVAILFGRAAADEVIGINCTACPKSEDFKNPNLNTSYTHKNSIHNLFTLRCTFMWSSCTSIDKFFFSQNYRVLLFSLRDSLNVFSVFQLSSDIW